MGLYVEAYNAAVGRFFERDLRAWGDMLSRRHAALRRPWARDRPPLDIGDADEDRRGDGRADS